jgi:glutamate-1-semialdehyde 2,1-aminomutase
MGVVPASKEFIQMLATKTKELGAVLIFDEVITGFRDGAGGMQQILGIQPDLTTLGKIIGSGFPAAAFGGRNEIMQLLAPLGEVYQAGTLSGNPIAMQAGLTALELVEEKGFYERLKQKTDSLLEPIQAYIKKRNLPCALNRGDTYFTLFFGRTSVRCLDDVMACDAKRFFDFFLFLFDRGIYFSPSPFEACFLSSAHTEEHLKHTEEAVLQYLADL